VFAILPAFEANMVLHISSDACIRIAFVISAVSYSLIYFLAG
jgi:hypothetical protein